MALGRPPKQIDKEQFESLCKLQCTLAEISGFFKCSDDAVISWCKRTYDQTFASAYKTYSQDGKISLRRMQFRLAEKNSAMAIWLGKQYLGQTDKQELVVTGAESKEAMDKYLEVVKNGKAKREATYKSN